MRRISRMLLVALALLTAGNLAGADAQINSDVKLVLQVTVDGLRADLLNRYGNRIDRSVGLQHTLIVTGVRLLLFYISFSYLSSRPSTAAPPVA